jgi:hypothetical protein
MTPAEGKIHEVGSVAFVTETVVDRLRVRASKIDGDGIAYMTRDELEAIADRLEVLTGYARTLHTKLMEERAESLKVPVADPAMASAFGDSVT